MNHTEFLGIEFPIIQAPMAGVQDHNLTVAVSNAGGMGSLPCAMMSAEIIRSEVAAIREQTHNPYNLNFFCHTPSDYDKHRDALWREELTPYFTEFNIDADDVSSGPSRAPFSYDIADSLETIEPKVISFHFGLPERDLLDRVKSWGTTILSSATTVAEAKWLEDNGADGVIAQGLEAGGHRGIFLSDDLTTQVGTFSLLPQITDAVNIPVIAAGGIASAKGVAAAISMGAIAVQIGTAYLLCDETKTSLLHRAALKSERAAHTALTNVFTGRPARGIVNRVIKEVGPISLKAPAFPMAAPAITALRQQAEAKNRDDFTPLWCGQNASACEEIGAGDLTRRLAGTSI